MKKFITIILLVVTLLAAIPVQNVEAKIAENRKIAEEIEKAEKVSEQESQEYLKASIDRINLNRKKEK